MAEDDSTKNHSIGNAPTVEPKPTSHGGRRFAAGDLILGRYRVESELGQGGMGVVYKCLDNVGGVKVAVKGLPPDVAHNEGEMEEIRANFQLVCDLRHENIAGVRTLEKDASGDYYLVMDLAHGEDLGSWMRKNKDADLKVRLSIIRQIASALDYAHRRKVMHRDIKPGNIMVSPSGRVLLLDFGLAAQISTSLSRTSHIVVSQSGTPAYKSPEQWRGNPQGAAADQYALAVVAYRLLSGRLPFDGDNVLILCRAVLEERPPAIKYLPSHINKALAKALSKDPHGRFPNCTAFVDALEGKSASGGLWRPILVALLSAGVLLAAGGVWLHFEKGKLEGPIGPQPFPTNEPPVVVDPPKVTLTEKPPVVVDPPKVTLTEKPPVVEEKPEVTSTEKPPVVEEKPKASLKEKPSVGDKPQPPTRHVVDMEFVKITNSLAVAVGKRDGLYKSAADFRKSPRGFSAKLKQVDAVWRARTSLDGKVSKQEAESALTAVSNEVGVLDDAVTWMVQNKEKRDGAVKSGVDFDEILSSEKKQDADLFGRMERNARWGDVQKIVKDAQKLIDEGSFDAAQTKFDEARKTFGHIRESERMAREQEANELAEKKQREIVAQKKRELLNRLDRDGFILDKEHNTRQPGTLSVIHLPRGEVIEMVWCPPGWFMMGSPETELERKHDERRHPVRLTKGFWIGKYEVTKGQWSAVMGGDVMFGIGKKQPMSSINWADCQNFMRQLKAVTGGKIDARLPTEAEWEYACRAGTSTPFSFGRQLNGTQAACNRAAPYGTTEFGPISLWGGVRDVGCFSAYANNWGINDMHGNVYEWCEDYFDRYPNTGDVIEDPRVVSAIRRDAQTGRSETLTTKVIRGGAWNYDPHLCRSACRNQCVADQSGGIVDMTGFRICCDDLP